MREENAVFEEGDKIAVKAINSSVKKRKLPDEHSFGNVGPIKYKIGDCINLSVPWIAWCMFCEDKISWVEIMARNI